MWKKYLLLLLSSTFFTGAIMSTTYLSGDASNSNLASTTNDIIRQQQASQVTQIFKDDTGTRRVLLGKGADGFYGLKVSQTGIDVFTAANDELVFNSDNNVFKVVDSGTATIPASSLITGASQYNSVTANIDIPHSYGVAPIVLAFIDLTGGSSPISMPFVWYDSVQTTILVQSSYYITSDSNSFGFTRYSVAYNQTSTFDWDDMTVKYYVLQETAN
jgi:hypothetical protein